MIHFSHFIFTIYYYHLNATASLKIPEFRNFVLARLFFMFALQMQATIVAWQVYAQTHRKIDLGNIGLSEIISFLLVAFFAGHLADVYNRKRLIQFSAILYLFCAAALYFLSTSGTYLLAKWDALPFFVIVFITGIARGILSPSQSALMAQLVPKELYTNSSTWNSIVWHLAMVLGPAVGGILYGKTDAATVYLCVIVFASIGFVFYSLIPSQEKPVQKQGEPLVERLSAGLKYTFGQPILLGAMAMDMFAVLFGGAVAMLPVFADEVLHIGSEGLGYLRAAPAVGSVLMSFVMTKYPPHHNAGKKLLLSVGLFGLATICFALSTNFYLSFFLLFLTGVFDNVSVVLRSTILQLYTPDEMRGRVSAISGIFIGSSNELGMYESGLAAEYMGLEPSVIFGGAMTLLVVMITYKIAPTLRDLQLK
ncbi:MAG: MFS transporter [Bacteroidia bacterium]